MPKAKQKSTEVQVMESIVEKENIIVDHMEQISKLFPEFSLDWLTGIEKNYDSFLDYLTLAIKTHNANKSSKK